MDAARISLHELAMAELLPVAAALRSSVDVDDATWDVVVDGLSDALLLGATLGAEAVVEHAEESGIYLDVELDLLPGRRD
jgi:hypothetical protein